MRAHAAHAAAALHIVTNATIKLSLIPYSDIGVILLHGYSNRIVSISIYVLTRTFISDTS